MVKHYRYYERVQPHAARTMKEKEPSSQEEMLIKQLEEISPKQLLKEISGGAEATKADLQIVEDVMINQKLTPGVVNVLIYYVMLRSDMKLAKRMSRRLLGIGHVKGRYSSGRDGVSERREPSISRVG